MLKKIVSGGQTGADRAALDFAIDRGILHGGWCPKGRLASDGRLDDRYLLTETESAGYRQRTKLNVRDSGGTLVLNMGDLDGGTLQTQRFATSAVKPCLVLQIDHINPSEAGAMIDAWIARHTVAIMNVAGPREDKRAGIYARALAVLRAI